MFEQFNSFYNVYCPFSRIVLSCTLCLVEHVHVNLETELDFGPRISTPKLHTFILTLACIWTLATMTLPSSTGIMAENQLTKVIVLVDQIH